jgi:putative nucleotidyltransferase with HDIG domain
MTALSAADIATAVDEVPALPSVVLDLLASVGRDNLSLDQLARSLARDQGLALRVLRVANSAFYGLPRRVGTVREAAVVLGVRAIHSLVAAAALVRAFPSTPETTDVWRHAFAVASVSRTLAMRLRADCESAFTAGLLHDIGRAVLLLRHGEAYADMRAACRLRNVHPVRGECDELGTEHGDVGFMLAQRWRIPEGVAVAVRDHHHPHGARDSTLAAVVQVADAVVHSLDLEADPDETVPPVDAEIWQCVAPADNELPGLLRHAEAAWQTVDLLTGRDA